MFSLYVSLGVYPGWFLKLNRLMIKSIEKKRASNSNSYGSGVYLPNPFTTGRL